jgi:predicted Zn-dependent protease
MSIGSSEVELETTRSYLRVNTPVLLADSERRLRKLYERFPQSVDIAECLAFVVSFADRPQEALQYFTAALANGSHNSEIVLLYVRLARAQGVPPETVLEMLSRALRSNPTNQELLFLLGQLAVEAGDYSTAVQAMTSIQCSGSVQRQYARFYTLAYCSLKQNKPDLTREYASLAKTYATTNEDVRRANNLARLGEFESKGSKVHVFDPKLIIRTN